MISFTGLSNDLFHDLIHDFIFLE